MTPPLVRSGDRHSASAVRLRLFVAALLSSVQGLPNWRPSFPSMDPGCILPGDEYPSLSRRLVLVSPEAESNSGGVASTDLVVEFVRPHCAVAGTEVRLEVFLNATNEGELGLSNNRCAEDSVELIHSLDNSWTESWYLLYGGTYSLCHRKTPDKPWRENAKVYLVEPSPRHCALIRTSASTDGFVGCKFPDGEQFKFFDGFRNEVTDKPDRCSFDCNACLAEGGTCECHGAHEGGTCNVCAAQCSVQQLTHGTCNCVTP